MIVCAVCIITDNICNDSPCVHHRGGGGGRGVGKESMGETQREREVEEKDYKRATEF